MQNVFSKHPKSWREWTIWKVLYIIYVKTWGRLFQGKVMHPIAMELKLIIILKLFSIRLLLRCVFVKSLFKVDFKLMFD